VSPISTQPPEDAALPDRPAHAPTPGDIIPSHYRWCVGCGPDHGSGLHMVVTALDGLAVRGDFTVADVHQGAPGLAHGGIISTAFDEVLGALNWLIGDPVVTARLEVDFKRPVPVGETLRIMARITGVQGRKVFTQADGFLADGALAATASALFVQVPLEHFLKHGEPEFVEQAIADRAAGGPAWRTTTSKGNVDVNP
jgi:acyl-coenzyme A thioesterase PaaI-like protein